MNLSGIGFKMANILNIMSYRMHGLVMRLNLGFSHLMLLKSVDGEKF